MCGIAGWIDFKRSIKEHTTITDNMLKTLSLRGPDESGSYISNNVILLHRRLSVIDIENGKQPMYIKHLGKEYIIVYNGELYNTESVRKELLERKYKFNGHSDTEVLLNSYIEWGDKCLDRLNGIFAFAIYNKSDNSLFLARDRAGVKPLFYHKYNEGIIFGSEIKTLLANPNVSRKVTKNGIAEILLIGPGRTPGASAFYDIEELKPGQCGTFTKDGLKLKTYWEIEAKEHTDNLADTIEKTRSLISDSINRQLISDVPLCCFLSGGLDSSIISYICAEKYRNDGKSLTTYSVDYTDNYKYFKSSFFQPNSDDYYIDIMKDAINSNHKKIILNNESVSDALYDSTLARDLPGMADVDSSLLLFCKEVKKKHTVALSGECADEIFGGYPWYSDPEVLYKDDFPWSGNTEIKSKLIVSNLLIDNPTEYVYSRYLETVKSAPKTGNESAIDSRIKEVTMLNFKWFMQTLLDRKDRMSMYNGLEVRVPFCDHRIMEYAYNIPWEIKAYKGREKGLLRKTFEGILPDEIVKRKKSPYPKSHHPLYIKSVKQKVALLLNTPSAPIWDILDKSAVKNIYDTEGNSFTRPWYGQLMNFPQIMAYIYMINTWLCEYKVDVVK